VIFPAITAPFVVPILVPPSVFFALASEVAVYQLLNRELGLNRSLLLVMVANIVSWCVGIGIAGLIPTSLFPSGLTTQSPPGVTVTGSDFDKLVLIAYLAAYILSILIEYAVLRLAIKHKFPIKKPLLTALIANTVSYILLLIIVWFVIRY